MKNSPTSKNKPLAVITGGATGVGAATTIALAKDGHNLSIVYNKSEKEAFAISEKCKSYGAKVSIYQANFAIPSSYKDLVNTIYKNDGHADILINNAATTTFTSYEQIDKLTTKDFDEILAINVIAPFYLSQQFGAKMKQKKEGVILNISSTAGINGIGSSIPYATSKGALNTLTLALAKALAPVRVNAICPSFVTSGWWEKKFNDKEFASFKEAQKNKSLTGKNVSPDDIAHTILYLIQNKSITGEIIRIDAGKHLT